MNISQNLKVSHLVKTSLGRKYIREVVNATTSTKIVVIDGKSRPRIKGSSSHYETNGGRMIYHPSAYAKVGWSNMNYVPSTIRVEVGRHWKPKLLEDYSNRISFLSEVLSSLGIVTQFNSESRTYHIISDDKKFCYWDLPISEYRKISKRIINCATFL